MIPRKKLIEVALPLEAINIASAREKSRPIAFEAKVIGGGFGWSGFAAATAGGDFSPATLSSPVVGHSQAIAM